MPKDSQKDSLRKAKITGISTPNVELGGKTGTTITSYGGAGFSGSAVSGGVSTPTGTPTDRTGLITSADSERTPLADYSQMTWPALIHARTENFSPIKIVWFAIFAVALYTFFRGLEKYRVANSFIDDLNGYKIALIGPLLPETAFLLCTLVVGAAVFLWKITLLIIRSVSRRWSGKS